MIDRCASGPDFAVGARTQRLIRALYEEHMDIHNKLITVFTIPSISVTHEGGSKRSKTIALVPGRNEDVDISLEHLNALYAKNTAFRANVDAGVIAYEGSPEPSKVAKTAAPGKPAKKKKDEHGFTKFNVTEARDLIAAETDIKGLKAWLEVDERPVIVEMLELRIKDLTKKKDD